MYTYVYVYAHSSVCIYRREMNDINDMKDGREELGLFYYKVLLLPLKYIML